MQEIESKEQIMSEVKEKKAVKESKGSEKLIAKEVFSKKKYVKLSAKKLRRIANVARGKNVNEILNSLKKSTKQTAPPTSNVQDVLSSLKQRRLKRQETKED